MGSPSGPITWTPQNGAGATWTAASGTTSPWIPPGGDYLATHAGAIYCTKSGTPYGKK